MAVRKLGNWGVVFSFCAHRIHVSEREREREKERGREREKKREGGREREREIDRLIVR